ncbi:MAG TPA: hypothetical protein VI953_03235 [Candidatus Paceibacterota bacterium]
MIDYVPKLPGGSGSFFGNFTLPDAVIGSNVLWIIFLCLFVVLGITTIVLFYHWIKYGFGDKNVILAQILYTLVTLAALGSLVSVIP